jgi:hypothetical protein
VELRSFIELQKDEINSLKLTLANAYNTKEQEIQVYQSLLSKSTLIDQEKPWGKREPLDLKVNESNIEDTRNLESTYGPQDVTERKNQGIDHYEIHKTAQMTLQSQTQHTKRNMFSSLPLPAGGKKVVVKLKHIKAGGTTQSPVFLPSIT